MTIDIELMREICNTPGLPGHEDPIQAVVTRHFEKSCDEVSMDRMGNVIGIKRKALGDLSKEPVRVMIAAHCDELGMMVRHIDNDGYLFCTRMGGIDPISCVSQIVTVHGKRDIKGVIPHHTPVKDNAIDHLDLRVDTGLPPDVVKSLVEPGDLISFAQEFVQFDEKILMARNFDDRMSTYCLVEAMRRVGPTEAQIYAISSTQEEVGTRGIEPAVRAIEPVVGLAIDGAMPHSCNIDKTQRSCDFGKGTGIYLIDNVTIGSPALVRFLFELGKKYGIPCQKNLGGGTDANKIQRAGKGCLATTIGVPTRYMHSTTQLCHADDVEATVQLMVRFMEHAHELGEVMR